MDADEFKHFDTETRKAMERVKKELDSLNGKAGMTANARRRFSGKVLKKLQSDLDAIWDEHLKSPG